MGERSAAGSAGRLLCRLVNVIVKIMNSHPVNDDDDVVAVNEDSLQVVVLRWCLAIEVQ